MRTEERPADLWRIRGRSPHPWTIKGITGAWVQDQKVDVENGKIVRYRVNMKVSFILA